MRLKKFSKIWLLFIFVLALAAGFFDYPQIWNQGADFLNSQKNQVSFLKSLPNIPQLKETPFHLGLDLQGGIHLIYEADLKNIEEKDKSQKMEGLKDVIERRVNLYGVTEPIIQIQKGNRLIVELAGIKDVGDAIAMIGETPYLEFRESISEQERQEAMQSIPDEQILEMIELFKEKADKEITKEEVLEMLTSNVFKPTKLTGEYLKRAQLAFDQTTNRVQIELQFAEEGSKLFEEITERNVGKNLAIFLDGMSIIDTDGDGQITNNDLYAPVVQEKITGGRAVITGEMDIKKAKRIIQRLNSGALPVKIGKPISQKTIGPILGKISLEKSLKAGLFGFLAVILFLIFFYRLPGILASLALVIYVGIVLSLFKLIPVTLSLAGIGGFILSLGMAVDANILIFSRMKEEIKEGRGFADSIAEGFRRAWPSIRDGNFTTLIVALILFSFGTSFVKGFAMTLGIGILVSMFSAIVITKTFLRMFENRKIAKTRWLWG